MKTFAVIFLSLLLVGCFGKKEIPTVSPIVIMSEPVEEPKLRLAQLPPLKLGAIRWVIVDDNGTIYRALTKEDYQVLSNNALKLDLYISQLLEHLNTYKKFYEGEKKEDANDTGR